MIGTPRGEAKEAINKLVWLAEELSSRKATVQSLLTAMAVAPDIVHASANSGGRGAGGGKPTTDTPRQRESLRERVKPNRIDTCQHLAWLLPGGGKTSPEDWASRRSSDSSQPGVR